MNPKHPKIFAVKISLVYKVLKLWSQKKGFSSKFELGKYNFDLTKRFVNFLKLNTGSN